MNNLKVDKTLTDYWANNFVNQGHCSLCGNTGRIDTIASAITAAGLRVGRINYCICPNGQLMRRAFQKR